MYKIILGLFTVLIISEGYLLRVRTTEKINLANENIRLKSQLKSKNYPFIGFFRLLAVCSRKDSISLHDFQSFFSKDTINLACEAYDLELSLIYPDEYKSSDYDKIIKIKGYEPYYFLFKDSVFVKVVNPLINDDNIDDDLTFKALNETDFFIEEKRIKMLYE
ncbi:MAG: hypothetical protein MJZ00_08035 [Paludibacteraceae bacterium]|nr:hypothetical protein [Paludibacteraceae bacterium]